MTGPEAARGPQGGRAGSCGRARSRSSACRRAPAAPGRSSCSRSSSTSSQGDIHLVGRSDEPIDGRPVLKSPDELPEGVDLAVFTLPAAGVREAVAACVRRKVGSAMMFAAGFAEVGEQRNAGRGRPSTARDGGLAIVGPNCLGVTNNVDGMMLHMLFAREALRFGPGSKPRRCVRRPERRHARPFPARHRRARHAAVLRDLDRQRGRSRNDRLHRIPRRRSRDQRARALHRADPPAARIPRRHPALPRRRQAGRADVSGPQRQVAAGRAVAHRRAGRRLRHHAHPGRGCRRHRRHHHGRDDGPRRNPGALSRSRRSRGRASSPRRARSSASPTTWPRSSASSSRGRAGDAEEVRARCCRPTATTAIRSTPPPASRRNRCLRW